MSVHKLPISETTRQNAVIDEALLILGSRIRKPKALLASPEIVKQYLVCHFCLSEREVFSVLWTDVKNGLIAHEILFHGTLTHCSVYPREVVKAGLVVNAAGCILVHNHPAGSPEPSEADKLLTRVLQQALALVDTRVLDHIIVAGTKTFSFAEHGLI